MATATGSLEAVLKSAPVYAQADYVVDEVILATAIGMAEGYWIRLYVDDHQFSGNPQRATWQELADFLQAAGIALDEGWKRVQTAPDGQSSGQRATP
jgi:hypothetical protein